MGITAAIRAIIALIIIVVIAGAGWWITGLRADLAIRENNERTLQESLKTQQEAIRQIQADQARIAQSNAELAGVIRMQNRDMDDLRNRFNTNARGEQRDFGATAAAKPQSAERAVNRGTVNAYRCLEIASGSPLTEAEKAAKTPQEINRECPSMANPNYKPTAGR
jgi:DNA repair exonuclease SbcCD ATPase subunit